MNQDHYTIVRQGTAYGPMTAQQLAIWLSARTGETVAPSDAVAKAQSLSYEIYDGK